MNRIAILTTMALAGAAHAQIGVELVTDGSFEETRSPLKGGGFVHWEAFNNAFADDVMEVPPLDGNITLKTFSNGAPGGVQGDSGAFQTVQVPDAGGKTFRITVNTYSPSFDPIFPLDFDDNDGNGNFGHLPLMLMAFQDANGDTLSQPEQRVFDPTVDPLDTWVEATVEGIAPAGTTQITVFPLFIGFGDDPGALYWDVVSLQEVEATDCDPADADPDKLVSDSTAPWSGFMNVSELDGTFVFGSGWGLPDLTSSFDDNVPSVTMSPVQVDDPDPYWYIGGGGPGQQGNKLMEANLFQEIQACLANQNVTFSGFVQENTLTEDYLAEIWIKDFAGDFSSFNETRIEAAPGPFDISLMTVDDPTRVVQWGFSVTGPNVWPGDEVGLGQVTFSSVAGGGGCNAADVAEPFGVLDLSDVNAFVTGFTGQTPVGDINNDGIWDLSDITAFVDAFNMGCP